MLVRHQPILVGSVSASPAQAIASAIQAPRRVRRWLTNNAPLCYFHILIRNDRWEQEYRYNQTLNSCVSVDTFNLFI